MFHHRIMMRTPLVAAATLLCASLSLWAPRARAAVSPINITVYGGTGNIGQRIVNEALSRGDHVTVVVRKLPEHAEHRPGLVVVAGDVLDSAAVAKQIAGQDVVISAVRAGSSQGSNFYVRVGESLVAALRSLGTRAPRLISVGGASSLEIEPGKLMLDTIPNVDHNSDPYTQNEALNYYRGIHDVSWTVVSPPGQIRPGKRTGKFRLGHNLLLKDSSGKSSISMEDFAIAIIDEAEHPQHVRQRFTVAY